MLRILPENISNLIAAGEVVARPASVIKELVENSIDAGAQSVSVFVTDSGRTSMRVIDDGCGMSPEEAGICFERHATSKIAEASDLEKIMTYGFRGEALPSIASVAEVTLKTRRAEDEVGFKVEMAASKLISSESVATPKGTSIEVRNLFYNVPARRKFLKSDATELRLIVSEFLRVAIIRPQVALRLVSNGRDIYNLKAADGTKRRIRDIFGLASVNKLSDVAAETSVVNVRGFVCAPEDARKTAGLQYFFVNGRFFKSPYLHKAVCKPYEKLIPEGYLPSYFLFLETNPDRVDVNIHPAKTEVKFEDEQMIFEIVMAAVREALGRDSLIPSIDFDQKGAPEIPTMQSTVAAASAHGGCVAPPKIDYSPLFDPFKDETGRLSRYSAPAEFEPYSSEPQVTGYSNQIFNDAPQCGEALFILKNKYIVARSDEGIIAVNILRARERVFYERYMEQVVEQKPVTAKTLFPRTIHLTVEDVLLLEEESRTVKEMGFELQPDGENVTVTGLPDGFPTDEEGVHKALDGLLAALRDESLTDDYRQALAEKLARSAAASVSRNFSAEEARILLRQLYECRCPGTTSDGRRTMIEFTTDFLDKQI